MTEQVYKTSDSTKYSRGGKEEDDNDDNDQRMGQTANWAVVQFSAEREDSP